MTELSPTCVDCAYHDLVSAGDYCVMYGAKLDDLGICPDFVEIIDDCNGCDKCSCSTGGSLVEDSAE